MRHRHDFRLRGKPRFTAGSPSTGGKVAGWSVLYRCNDCRAEKRVRLGEFGQQAFNAGIGGGGR